jgi:hypothetical protein
MRERLVRLTMSNGYWAELCVLERLVINVILGTDFLEVHRVVEASKYAFFVLPEIPELLPNILGILQLNRFESNIAKDAGRLKKKIKTAREVATSSVSLVDIIQLQD